METVKKTSYPTRSQSQHVRSKTSSPSTPSRPLSRKNQTRRSLNAMEKQADDLYSFLSELEDHKSAGPEKLKEFLEKSDRAEKSGGEISTPRVSNLQHRTSIKDRMKQFSSIGEENKSPAKSQKGQPPRPIDEGTPARTPQPPKRSDSMKRLELARAKHVGLGSPYKPLSPGNKSPNQLPPQSEIAEFDLGPTKNAESSTSGSDKLENRSRDSLSSTSSHSEEHMQSSSNSDHEGLSMRIIQPESGIVNNENLKPSTTEEPQEKSESPVQKQYNRPIIESQDDDVVSETTSDKPLTKEPSKQEATPTVVNEEEVVTEKSKSEKGRIRTRRVRNRKPDLPPKPAGLSPSCSPHRSPARSMRGDDRHEKTPVRTRTPVVGSGENQSKRVSDPAEDRKEMEQKTKENEREARREARRVRRMHDQGSKSEKKTSLPDEDSHTSSVRGHRS